jgi:hypothetical protein
MLTKLFVFPDPDIFLIFFLRKKVNRIIAKNNIDIIIISIIPYSLLVLLNSIKSKYKDIEVIVDMSDPLSCSVVSKYKFAIFIKRHYEKKYLSKIDKLIVLNQEIKDYYSQFVSADKIYIIEQGIDDCKVGKSDSIIPKNKMIYTGSFYKHLREPFVFYQALIELKLDSKLLLIGNIKKAFLPKAKELYNYVPQVPYFDLDAYYKECSIIIFFDNFYGIQVPGKLLEILNYPQPILFIYDNSDSPSFKYINDYDGVFIVKNEISEIKREVLRIISIKHIHYSRDISKYKWSNLLKNVY